LSLLITGGTGSFGRAFVRQWSGDRICIYSRGEHTQAQMRDEFRDDPRIRWFIGDVRDRDRLRRAMNGVEVVVHAAALKRIEVGAYNPIEMCKTNIDGAVNVIEAAHDAGVAKVVALSSDKAFQPVSPYGFSKALAESLFLSSNHGATRFAVTRYGNVAGSAGSVIPRWQQLVHSGLPVPVTDPECTRFWMTLGEAVELVANTIRSMKGGELAIPDLPAYRLGDLAEAMGAYWKVTGLPAWEKKHESMREGMSSEHAHRMSVAEIREALCHIHSM
jgi:UDP-N-acetylglucosamine 4,6-dehydratase